jgi:hypothetical protein
MITLLRVVFGSFCLMVAAVCIGVALRQYRREITWRRVVAVVQRPPGGRETELAYTDAEGVERVARHWGISSTTPTGARVTLLHHPRAPDRVAVPFGPSVLAVLALLGLLVGLLGLILLANALCC